MQRSFLAVFLFAAVCSAVPYQEMVPAFSRTKSMVMVRKVDTPTLANLDYAAYDANPVRYDPQKFSPKPTKRIALADLTFSGKLSAVCDNIAQTPLSEQERSRPMSWKALENRIWDLTKEQGFQDVASRVASEKFGDRSVYKPFQEIAAAYLHEAADGAEVWVRIEFMPWVKFLDGVNDDDNDGYAEIYGKLSLEQIPPEKLAQAIEWIRGEYTVRTLSRDEIKDWINLLASYWYPTMNTDVLDMSGDEFWPTKQTEKKVLKQLKGVKVSNPVAVVRGNPFGKPVYNIYDVPSLDAPVAASEQADEKAPQIEGDKTADTVVSAAFKENMARFDKELKANGGSWEAWAKKNAGWLDAIRGIVSSLPQEQMGFKGKGDWVFFRKSLEMISGGELGKQAKNKNPIPHLVDLKKNLAAQNVNLLFVVVPNKEDVYYEHLSASLPDASDVILNPYGRKILKDIQDAGIEVVDLLPLFLKAKAEDASSGEAVYQRQDTHWTDRGLQIAAAAIAQRIEQYGWYAQTESTRVTYATRDTTFSRQGDIVERLPEGEKGAFPAVTLKAQRVYTPDGAPYNSNNKNAPVMLMGDSFTGVFELVDCKSAGVGAHVAAKTGLPVDVITSWGGGPLVRQRALRARKNEMPLKRLVIYLMVARDLYDYSQLWAPLE